MRATKIGHSCLLIEEAELRILMDPGNYNPVPQEEAIDAILITHEHDDHCYVPVIQKALKRNQAVEIITHDAVGKKLETAGLKWTAIRDGEAIERKGVKIASYGTKHARIHPVLPIFANTGFLIADRLFHPGDSFYQPPTPVEILALPSIGSWMKLEEAIEYAKAIKPKVVFPIHDGILIPAARTAKSLAQVLPPIGIKFVDAVEGTVLDI